MAWHPRKQQSSVTGINQTVCCFAKDTYRHGLPFCWKVLRSWTQYPGVFSLVLLGAVTRACWTTQGNSINKTSPPQHVILKLLSTLMLNMVMIRYRDVSLMTSQSHTGGAEVQLRSSLTSAVDGGQWSTSCASCFTYQSTRTRLMAGLLRNHGSIPRRDTFFTKVSRAALGSSHPSTQRVILGLFSAVMWPGHTVPQITHSTLSPNQVLKCPVRSSNKMKTNLNMTFFYYNC